MTFQLFMFAYLDMLVLIKWRLEMSQMKCWH